MRDGRGEGCPGRFARVLRGQRPALQHRLRFAGAPGAGGDAAQRDAGLAHSLAVEVQGHGGRCKSEFVGLPVAYLQIERTPGPRSGGNCEGGDQLARLERGFTMRSIARLQVQLFERHPPLTARAERFHNGIQRHQRLGEVSGIGGDAVLRDAQHRMLAIDPLQGSTAGAGLALVAGAPVGIAEIGTPGALQHIAAERAHVADLSAGGQHQAVGDHRIVPPHRGMVGHLGHPRQGPKPQAVRRRLDAPELALEPVDVDQRFRSGDPQPHVIDDVGAAGQELHRRAGRRLGCRPGGQADGGDGIGGALVGEGLHQVRLIRGLACSTAFTMCG